MMGQDVYRGLVPAMIVFVCLVGSAGTIIVVAGAPYALRALKSLLAWLLP